MKIRSTDSSAAEILSFHSVAFATLGLEYFEDYDNNNAVALVPKTAQTTNGQFVGLLPTDIVESWSVLFSITGTTNAYTAAVTTSPYFPYNAVQLLEIPYQSGNIKLGSTDGHMWFLWSALRGTNMQQLGSDAGKPILSDQGPILSTGYSAQSNLNSASNYTVAASTTETYNFSLRVPGALYFRNFWDDDGKGNIGVMPDVYVNPIIMSATGRNITPKITTNPVFGSATLDGGPFSYSGAGTAPTWTDGGSTVTIRKSGWRDPAENRPPQPQFGWAHVFDTFQYTGGATAKWAIPMPDNGQLLAIIFRFFDPTLATNLGGAIDLANIVTGSLSYGPGLVKYNDAPADMQRRIWRQHGFTPTKGVWIWDLYRNSQSNMLGEILNTYITAGIVARFDFTGHTPGAGSYATVSAEWLTQVA